MNLSHKNLFLPAHVVQQTFGCYSKFISEFQIPESALDTSHFKLAIGIITIAEAVFIILANSIFIYGLLATNKTLSYVQKLFVYQSCIDLLVGLIPIPIQIVYIFKGLSCVFMSTLMAFGCILLTNDSLIFLTISLLRFFAITKPLKSINYKMVTIYVVCQQLASFLITCYVFYVYLTSTTLAQYKEIWYVPIPFQIIINSITVMFVMICLQFVKRGNSSTIHHQRHSKSIKTLLIIGLTMLVLIIAQSTTYVVLFQHFKKSLASYKELESIVKWIDIAVISTTLGPGLNSVIYISRSKKLRRFYFGVFTWKN